ncbi:histone-lysine N-methyltransferase [Actinidia rufa]|uniref:Histone-lysine N-methyltransferase n=1 Tax=Actinidia rufa TaxID=165716 RepID=A0A7J0GA40_9ERIC|nr:histone-lysine N-methyltransferase [Actinidia rufa]
MYGQGNYAAQFGRGPHTPMPPLQQRPVASPSPSLQQGPSASQPSTTQQGPPPFQHYVGHSGSFVYQHPPPLPVQQGPPFQVPTRGVMNAGLSYLPPPPPPPLPQQVRGSPSVVHPYPTAPQNSQWTQNKHHIPTPVPPSLGPPPTGPSGTEMFRTLIPPRVSSTPPSQEHTPYRGPIHLPQPGGDALACDDYKNPEGGTSYESGSPLEEDLSDMEGTQLDLPPPPPKPEEEKVVRRIEVLCCFIAKSGPSFEDMARQKECGNPEFEFLFGGEPGSEAAVAHEYFEWMKNKCVLECKSQHEHNNLTLRPLRIGTSMQTSSLMDAGVSHSPCDSDMDMEDDITQPGEEHQVYNSFVSLNSEAVLIPKESDIQEQSRASQNAIEQSLCKNAISGSSGLAEREKGSELFLDHDHFTYGRSLPNVDSSVVNSAGAAECPSISNLEKSSIPPLEESSQSNASAAAAGTGSKKFPGELIEGASPFRLLQDYASDDSSEDDDKPCLEDVSPIRASPSPTAGGTSLNRDTGNNLQRDPGLKSLSSPDVAVGTFSETVVTCSLRVPSNALEIFPESQRNSWDANITSIAGENEELIENNNKNQVSTEYAVPPKELQQKIALDGLHNAAPESGKSQCQKEDLKYTSTLQKVDEFGRLIREGASDSDSDDLQYTGRRRKRGRTWSRSPSPEDRRRRSPRRRKEKRSRSRSWSPKKRSSRSRSPSHRRGGESSGDKMRRDKGQLLECFDFLRGRCYRGAFCRYMHHDKSDGARCYRSKQQHVEVPPVSRTSDFHKETEKAHPRRSVHDQDMNSFGALEEGSMDREKVSVFAQGVQTIISDQENKSLVTGVVKSERSTEVNAVVREIRDITNEILEPMTELLDDDNCLEMMETVQSVDGSPSRLLTDSGAPKSPGDVSHGMTSSLDNLVIPQSQANPSIPVLQNAHHQSLDADESSTPGSLLVQSSKSFQKQLPVSAPHLNKTSPIQSYTATSSIGQTFSCDGFSSQALSPKELIPRTISAVNFSDHRLQLPPALPSLSQSTSTPLPPPPQMPGEIMPPTSIFPSLYPSMVNCLPNHASLQSQHSHFSVPPNSSSLPPPPPPPPRPPFVNNSTTFVRPYPPQPPAHSQTGELQHHNYSLMMEQELPRSSSHMEDFRPNPLPMGNSTSQPCGGTGLVWRTLPTVSSTGFNPFICPGKHICSICAFYGGLSSEERIQSLPGDNLPSDEYPMSFQKYPQLQQQRPLYGLHRPEVDNHTLNIEFRTTTILMHPLLSSHYPPKSPNSASMLSNKKRTSCKRRTSNKRTLNEKRKSNKKRTCHTVSSMIQFFDSIEPSSNSFEKLDHGQRRELLLRLSGSRKLLDVEVNKKQKEVEAIVGTTSIKSENDEYSETADAEVGDVDDVSASNPLDDADIAVGEVEIDQIKTSGKSKKSKDSRSMKLFKVSLANFVKEMLKPSWRQGNMSKEAFKTIVKKTVDKVSGAMKSHHIPKSQEKINQYIDSSQRKLTKLVMDQQRFAIKIELLGGVFGVDPQSKVTGGSSLHRMDVGETSNAWK